MRCGARPPKHGDDGFTDLFNPSLLLFRHQTVRKHNKMQKGKIGRNKLCSCGSGKKYKRCHGSSTCQAVSSISQLNIQDALKKKLAEIEAIQKQREKQQGLGRPIISAVFKGYRIVAVGNKIYWSDKWKTFHDFLLDYIKDPLGGNWCNEELKKPFNQQHPILQWNAQVCNYQKQTIKKPGEVHTEPMIGAVAAYLGLSYNLYLLAHNVKIQSKLVERLKSNRHFHGAYYETYVAAAFIKAGFDLEFENEADVSITHCEFTATCRKSGNKYSVEAKSREPNKVPAKIGHQLYKALKKKANFTRVIFIDVNVPDDADESQSIKWLNEALESLRDKEISMTINGEPAPEAYVFVTNHPHHYNLEKSNFRRTVLAEGFKIPEFKMGAQYLSIRDALQVRRKHADMFQLISSIREHYKIPSTFDGDIPELAFGTPIQRLKIGQKYLIPDSDRNELIGELVDAVVSQKQKLVYGTYRLEDGKSVIATCPLSDNELSAYRRYPDTFFGIYRPQGKKIKNPLESFDFFYKSYRNTSKERLLELLKKHPQIEKLKEESQNELAITYCESLVYSSLNSNKSLKKD